MSGRTSIIIFSLVMLLCVSSIQAGQGKQSDAKGNGAASGLSVSFEGCAQIKITNKRLIAAVDFEDDIGCLDFSLYDPATGKEFEDEDAGIRVMDKVFKDGYYYLLLHAVRQSNWNVQGWCGASKDHTIIWLKLDANLQLKDKKAAAVADCKAGIFMLDPKSDDFDALNTLPELQAGRFVVGYGAYEDYSGKNRYSRLSYDSKCPEKGLLITTKSKK
jgi:hypothetical protein